MYPKLVALDTDWTLFSGWLNTSWGGGYGAIEDAIMKVNNWTIQDRMNASNTCSLFPDIPRIIRHILMNGAQIAIVSRNTSKAMSDRALWHWTVADADGKERPIIDLVKFDEVYDAVKTTHFNKIKGWAGFDYSDMILFDDDATSNIVEMMLGVTFQICRGRNGLTWDTYQQGIEMWRRNKYIQSPWRGLDVNIYPKARLIGYSGMDLQTIELLESGGRRHDRIEAARWGYAMYVADDPAVAKYFSDWIKTTAFGPSAQTIVCAIYARDRDIFDRMNKVWAPDQVKYMTDVNAGNDFNIAWSQEDRDKQVAAWGVQKPYVLFSRHPNMGFSYGLNFPVPHHLRWNEMVIYPQIQENLILTVRMTDSELDAAIRNPSLHWHYENNISSWNISVPYETRQDFAAHSEYFI